jgi:hypothetical protein
LTNGDKFSIRTPANPHILIAPLDWGLGHVTRCIPIIKQLLAAGCRVTLATDGKHARLLGQEFPNVELLPLSGYRLAYSANGRWVKWKIIFQAPKILTSIKREHRWLATQIARRKIDLVISDCRFGLYNKDVFCVLMTHQLTIKSPFGKWAEHLLRRWNYGFINKFNECWVPDFNGDANLAGELSHPPAMPRTPVKYIGALSRFSASGMAANTTYDVLVILSGPEPQRTMLEKILMKELSSYNGKAALVRGLPGEAGNISLPGVTVFNHLPSDELSALMLNSEFAISRSGYTTVMDLVKLRRKSILIPTPGQPEQEYLGRYLMRQRLCVCVEQDAFSLAAALETAGAFAYEDMGKFDMEMHKKEIYNTIADLTHA